MLSDYQQRQRLPTAYLRAFGQEYEPPTLDVDACMTALAHPAFDVRRERTQLMPTYHGLFLSARGARDAGDYDVQGLWVYLSVVAPIAAWGVGRIGKRGTGGWATLLEPNQVQRVPEEGWARPAATRISETLTEFGLTELHWRDLVRWMPSRSIEVATLARDGRPYRVFDLIFPVMD